MLGKISLSLIYLTCPFKDVGLTQKVLHLVDDGGIIGCPKQKLISRKCGPRKRRKHRKDNLKDKKRRRSILKKKVR